MDQNEAKIAALESSIEILKKTTSKQGNHIAEIKKSVEGINDMKGMLKRWMEKQGIMDEGDNSGKKSVEGEIVVETHEAELEGTSHE